jgi:hypothetical protein
MTDPSSDIIVDTSVARAAGESQHPVSSACRRFLEALRDGGIDLAMTDELREEWKRHRSRYTATWLNSMYGRKRIRTLLATPDPELRRSLENCAKRRAVTEAEAQGWTAAMLKDALLVEASICADNAPIAACDETVRSLFHECAKHVAILRELVWVNPTRSEEQPLDWLAAGAPRETARMLGS